MTEEYKGSRILLVEDEETLAVGLEYNLVEEGFVVDWAKNGREAVDFFKKEKYRQRIAQLSISGKNSLTIDFEES